MRIALSPELERLVQAGLEALECGNYDEYDDMQQLAAEIKARGRERLKKLGLSQRME